MPCAGARPLDHPFAAESHLRISNGEFLKLNSSECRPWTSPMQIWPILPRSISSSSTRTEHNERFLVSLRVLAGTGTVFAQNPIRFIYS